MTDTPIKNPHISAVTPRSRLIFAGVDCVGNSPVTVHVDKAGELSVKCTHGRHYLAGQKDDDGYLVGVTMLVPQE